MAFEDIDEYKPRGTDRSNKIDDYMRETRLWCKNQLAVISGFPDLVALYLAKWTTDTRPSNGKEGLFGYNETTKKLERHNGTSFSTIEIEAYEPLTLATQAEAELGDSDTKIMSPLRTKQAIRANVDIFYPVGSIYMSAISTSPATLFGGTWQQIKDRFLLAAGDTYINGNTDGSASHQLTINELPIFTPKITINEAPLIGTFKARAQDIVTTGIVSGAGSTRSEGNADDNNRERTFTINATHAHETTVDKIGGGQAHNNMPPYLVVFMWKRTA